MRAKKQFYGLALLIFSFAAILVYRLSLCFEIPLVTSDAYRNLGYASHLSTHGYQIYETVAKQFAGEAWTSFWPALGYLYPPTTLVFFGIFAKYGLGLFYVKLVLTIFELLSAILICFMTRPLIGLIYWALPVSIWYVSHEGQFEPLHNLFLVLSIFFLNRKLFLLAGLSLGISIQSKLFAILLIPWALYSILKTTEDKTKPALTKFFVAIVLSFLPFLGFYLATPDLLFLPAKNFPWHYSPFAWNIFNSSAFGWNPTWLVLWNGAFSYLALGLVLVAIFHNRTLSSAMLLQPYLCFLCLLKSLKWSQFWYSLAGAPFLLCFKERRRLLLVLMILVFLQGGRSAFLLNGYYFGVQENARSRGMFERCMYYCNLSVPKYSSSLESVR